LNEDEIVARLWVKIDYDIKPVTWTWSQTRTWNSDGSNIVETNSSTEPQDTFAPLTYTNPYTGKVNEYYYNGSFYFPVRWSSGFTVDNYNSGPTWQNSSGSNTYLYITAKITETYVGNQAPAETATQQTVDRGTHVTNSSITYSWGETQTNTTTSDLGEFNYLGFVWADAGDVPADDKAVIKIISKQPNGYREGNSDTTLATFTISIDRAISSPITVQYRTADATATRGSDYQAASGIITFLPGGSLTQTISVPIKGDTEVESDETFQVELSNPTGAARLGTSTATTKILNDDLFSGKQTTLISQISM
jgi:hypothetical protein